MGDKAEARHVKSRKETMAEKVNSPARRASNRNVWHDKYGTGNEKEKECGCEVVNYKYLFFLMIYLGCS